MSAPPPSKRGLPTLAIVVVALVLLAGVCVVCGAAGIVVLGADGLDFGEEPNSDAPSWEPDDVPRDFRQIVGAPMPPSAANCHYVLSAGIDVFGVLRCDMAASEVAPLMRSAGLTPWSAGRTFTDDTMWLDFDGAPVTPAPAWWTPPTVIDEHVYVAQRGSGWTFARHDGTTLWLKTISH